MKGFILILLTCSLSPLINFGQASKDSLPINRQSAEFIVKKKVHNAVIRSAIVPGLGQAYNKKYWKIPIVYAALGTTGFLFARNYTQYKDSKDAYILATDNDPSNDFLIKEPYFSVKGQPDRIRDFRNSVRQNMDYCVLFFVFFWGLNVADAAVDAHLKGFDIGDNLSLQLKPGYSELGNTNGISLILKMGKHSTSK